MPINLAADLAMMFADAPGAVQVVMAGVPSTWGLFDAESAVQDLGGHLGVSGTTLALTIATGSLPGVKKGSSITAGGAPYKVLAPPSLKDDGSISVLWLEVP